MPLFIVFALFAGGSPSSSVVPEDGNYTLSVGTAEGTQIVRVSPITFTILYLLRAWAYSSGAILLFGAIITMGASILSHGGKEA